MLNAERKKMVINGYRNQKKESVKIIERKTVSK